MRMFRMRVRRVMMVMVMIVVVTMMMAVMIMSVIGHDQPAHPCAERVAMGAVRNVRAWCVCPLPFDVVMVAFLDGTNLGLKTQHLNAVFAQYAGRWRDRAKGGVFPVFRADVVMSAIFKRQHLFAISTNPAIGRGCVTVLLHDAFGKGFQHFGMIA